MIAGEVPDEVRRHRRDMPSPWVVRFAPLIAADGAVLDVASGTGRHARWLEARGHRVTAIDRDGDALAASGASEQLAFDLESDGAADWPLVDRVFAAVVVTNYLYRPLFPRLLGALAPGGVLLYETFAVGNEAFGRPRNPDFLLTSGELLERCRTLAIVAFEDGLVATPGPASIQRICAVRAADPAASGTRRHAL